MILASVRGGSKTYTGQIIAHADCGINDLDGLQGQEVRLRRPGLGLRLPLPERAAGKQNGIDYKTFFSETSSPAGTTRSSSPSTTSRSTAARPSATASRAQTTDARTTVAEHAAGRDGQGQDRSPRPSRSRTTRSASARASTGHGDAGPRRPAEVAETDEGKKLLTRPVPHRRAGAAPTDSDYDPVRKAREGAQPEPRAGARAAGEDGARRRHVQASGAQDARRSLVLRSGS